jgi:hypothetical protein
MKQSWFNDYDLWLKEDCIEVVHGKWVIAKLPITAYLEQLFEDPTNREDALKKLEVRRFLTDEFKRRGIKLYD